MKNQSSGVLVVGWPGAGWKHVLPLIQSGKLPVLAHLVERGSIGRFLTPPDAASAALWTTIATGQRLSRHHILLSQEIDPTGKGLRPTTCLGRQGKALWTLFSQAGVESQVFGWPASHPAEPIRGTVVSDFYARWPYGTDFTHRDWRLEPGSVHPFSLAAELSDLRMHPAEITGDDLLSLIPALQDLKSLNHPLLKPLAICLADTIGLHAAATHGMERETAGFQAVVYPGIDRISRLFGRYHGEKLDAVTEEEHALFQHVVEGIHVFHDQMLGRLLELAGPDTNVLLVSPEGRRLGEELVEISGVVSAPPETGLFVLAGPNIKQDHLVFGTRILDFAPTLLHLAGQAIPDDMEGQVISDALTAEELPAFSRTTEADAGEAGLHRADWRFTPRDLPIPEVSDHGAINESPRFARQLWLDWRYQLACSHIAAHEEGRAIPLLEEAWKHDPGESRYALRLMHCHMALGQTEQARDAFQSMMREKKQLAATSLRQWKALDAKPPGELTPWERHTKGRLWKRSRSNISGMSFLQAWLLQGEGKYQEALQVAEATDEHRVYNRPGLAKLKAESHDHLGDFQRALEHYEAMAAMDPELPDAHIGMAKVNYKMDRFKTAAEAAQNAINLRYFNPLAHYYKAASLYQVGWSQFEVIDALKVATKQEPMLAGAWQRLMLLHQSPVFGDEGQALVAHYKREWQKAKAKQAEHLQARPGIGEDPDAPSP